MHFCITRIILQVLLSFFYQVSYYTFFCVIRIFYLQDDPKQRRPDISFAKNALDWEPSVALEEGLQKTIDYFR